jgi:hypothetical protein
LRGKGTLSVDGGKNRWNGPWVKLKKVPKAIRAQWDLAVANAPLPPPPVPPAPPATTTTSASGS